MWPEDEMTYGLKMPLGLGVEEDFDLFCVVPLDQWREVLTWDIQLELPKSRRAYAIRL